MHKKWLFVILGLVAVNANYCYSKEVGEFAGSLWAEDAADRQRAFYSVVDMGGPRAGARCVFKVLDASSARKAVIELLSREQELRVKMLTQNRGVAEKMYRQETYSEYLGDLFVFVDSCEDEHAIPLFPGQKTFNKYFEKSAEIALKKMNALAKSSADEKGNGAYILGMLGEAAAKHRATDVRLYKRIKKTLISLAVDDCLGAEAMNAMATIGDQDFVPVLKKISSYDSTKGCRKISGGQETLFPLSEDARIALKEMKEKVRSR